MHIYTWRYILTWLASALRQCRRLIPCRRKHHVKVLAPPKPVLQWHVRPMYMPVNHQTINITLESL